MIPPENQPPSSQLTLFICRPHSLHCQVVTERTSQIGILNTLLDEKSLLFLHHGEILERSFTFAFYGIQSKDALIALPQNTSDHRRWLAWTKDQDSFVMKMRLMLDPDYRAAFCRLSDHCMTRFEMRARPHRQMVKKMLVLQDELDEYDSPKRSVVIPGTPKAISDQPLPVLW
jgi:hypothetical protein